jgi:GntR family transcriptional regulator
VADPMYRQIAEDLRSQIESGEIPPGSQLPTEIELREKYNASRNTIRDAIKWLTTRSLVETRPGQGTFVVEKINPFVTTLSDADTGGSGEVGIQLARTVAAREFTATPPRLEIQGADSRVAQELQVEPGTTVITRHQQRLIDGTPWSLQTSFYPLSLVERGGARLIQAENIKEGTVEYLERTLGIAQAGWRDTIMVRAPDYTETTFFGLPEDGRVAVIETLRTAFDQDGQPFRVTNTVYPADRTLFAIIAGLVPGNVLAPEVAKLAAGGRPAGGFQISDTA